MGTWVRGSSADARTSARSYVSCGREREEAGVREGAMRRRGDCNRKRAGKGARGVAYLRRYCVWKGAALQPAWGQRCTPGAVATAAAVSTAASTPLVISSAGPALAMMLPLMLLLGERDDGGLEALEAESVLRALKAVLAVLAVLT